MDDLNTKIRDIVEPIFNQDWGDAALDSVVEMLADIITDHAIAMETQRAETPSGSVAKP